MRKKIMIKLLPAVFGMLCTASVMGQVNNSSTIENDIVRGITPLKIIEDVKTQFPVSDQRNKSMYANDLSSIEYFNRNAAGSFLRTERDSYTYSDNGLEIVKIAANYNSQTQQYEEDSETTLTLSSDLKPLSFVTLSGRGSITNEFEYDESGRLSTIRLNNVRDDVDVNFLSITNFQYVSDDSVTYTIDITVNGDESSLSGYYVQREEDLIEVSTQSMGPSTATFRTTFYGTDLNGDLTNFDPVYITAKLEEIKIDQGAWTPQSRTVLEEDNGRILAATYSSYNPSTFGWEENFRDELLYGESANVEQVDTFEKDAGGQWVQVIRSDYSYNVSTSNEREDKEIREFILAQNYPNPFNPATNISFMLPEASEVRLEVFDMLGRRVATLLNNENRTAGAHTVRFEAGALPSGIYIYRLNAGRFSVSKYLTLIK